MAETEIKLWDKQRKNQTATRHAAWHTKKRLTKETENREHIQETQMEKKATSTHTEIITTSMFNPFM